MIRTRTLRVFGTPDRFPEDLAPRAADPAARPRTPHPGPRPPEPRRVSILEQRRIDAKQRGGPALGLRPALFTAEFVATLADECVAALLTDCYYDLLAAERRA